MRVSPLDGLVGSGAGIGRSEFAYRSSAGIFIEVIRPLTGNAPLELVMVTLSIHAIAFPGFVAHDVSV